MVYKQFLIVNRIEQKSDCNKKWFLSRCWPELESPSKGRIATPSPHLCPHRTSKAYKWLSWEGSSEGLRLRCLVHTAEMDKTKLSLSCLCQWCELNWRQIETVGDKKFRNWICLVFYRNVAIALQSSAIVVRCCLSSICNMSVLWQNNCK